MVIYKKSTLFYEVYFMPSVCLYFGNDNNIVNSVNIINKICHHNVYIYDKICHHNVYIYDKICHHNVYIYDKMSS